MPYQTFNVGPATFYKCPKCPTDLRSEEEADGHMNSKHGGFPMVPSGIVDATGSPTMVPDPSTAERDAEDNVIGTEPDKEN